MVKNLYDRVVVTKQAEIIKVAFLGVPVVRTLMDLRTAIEGRALSGVVSLVINDRVVFT